MGEEGGFQVSSLLVGLHDLVEGVGGGLGGAGEDGDGAALAKNCPRQFLLLAEKLSASRLDSRQFHCPVEDAR